MLKFEHPNGRYYYIYVQQDFFNDIILSVMRGGRNQRITRNILFNCPVAIKKEIDRLSKKRIKRGYVLIQ